MQDNEKKIFLLDYINRNESLGQTEKNILFKLYLLDNSDRGCYASDRYLSKMHNLSITTYNSNLKKLEDKGFIQRSNVYNDSGKHRMIKVNVDKIKETNIENDNPTYPNRQVPIVENDNPTYPNRQVPIVENDNAYTKENTKENTKEERENSPAFDFLKNNHKERYEREFKNKYSNKFKDDKERQKFITQFNAKVKIEIGMNKLKWDEDLLFARLDSYSNQWVDNQNKFKKEEEPPPVYTRKVR